MSRAALVRQAQNGRLVLLMPLWWNWHTYLAKNQGFVGSNPTSGTNLSYANVMEMVDMQDSDSCGESRGSSSLLVGTKIYCSVAKLV